MGFGIQDGAGIDHIKVGAIRDPRVHGSAGLGGGNGRAQARVVEELLELGTRLALFLAFDVKHPDERVGNAWIEQPLPIERHGVAGDGEVLIGLSDRKLEVVIGFGLQRLGDREVDDQIETAEDQDEQDEVLGSQAGQRPPEHQPDSR